MINYELAKKLKEAEFPHECLSNCEESGFDRGTGTRRYQHVCIPTLEELIEAVEKKKGFGYLSHVFTASEGKFHWEASGLTTNSARGETPNEAIAHLWLKLHEK